MPKKATLYKQSHYAYLEKHLPDFFRKMGVDWDTSCGVIRAHGDKAYGYRFEWEQVGIPFPHGVAIYLLSYCRPYSDECREMRKGWVAPKDWVLRSYERFRRYLPPVGQPPDEDLCCHSCAPAIEINRRYSAGSIPKDIEDRVRARELDINGVLKELGWENPYKEGTCQRK